MGRPAVISKYDCDLSSLEVWWEAWLRFMFTDPLTVKTKEGIREMRVFEMLEPMPSARYPAVSKDEERLGIPLQLLCLAIFDALMVYIMNFLEPRGEWLNVKARILNELYRNKTARTLEILADVYNTVDVVCLQEVGATF